VNRCIKLADLIPWDELEHHYATQFSKVFGAPAKPLRMALGAFIINEQLQVTDEKFVGQIKQNPYLQFSLGLESFQFQSPFYSSMMVHFRWRLPAATVNDCNERIVSYGKQRIDQNQHDGNDESGEPAPAASLRWSGFSGQPPSLTSEAGHRP